MTIRRPRRSRGVEQVATAPGREAAALSGALAFDELYRSSRDDVYSYVATLLADRSAAEDVTALAFERAYRKRSSFRRERGSERAWLFGIARNAALDELRRRRRTTELVSEPLDADASTPSEDAERSIDRATVRAAKSIVRSAKRNDPERLPSAIRVRARTRARSTASENGLVT